MASPTHRSNSTDVVTGTAADPGDPAGASENDGLVAYYVVEAGHSGFTGPGGVFTLLYSINATAFNLYVYTGRRGSSAPNYAVSWTTSRYCEAKAYAYQGCRTTGSIVDASAEGTPSNADANVNPPQVTTNTIETVVLALVAHWAGWGTGGATAPGSYNLRYGPQGIDNALADRAIATATTEDPGEFSNDGGTDWFVGVTIALASVGADSPAIESTSPADNATGVSRTASPAVTFNQNIDAGSGNFYIWNTTRDFVHEVIAAGSASISTDTATLNPVSDFVYGEEYAITWDAGVVVADDDAAPVEALTDKTVWNFRVVELTDAATSGGLVIGSPTSFVGEAYIGAGESAAALGGHPLESDPYRRPGERMRRGGPWSEPLSAFVPLGAFPLEEPPRIPPRARPRLVPPSDTPLAAGAAQLGAQPVEEPAARPSVRRRPRPPETETPLAGFLGIVPENQPTVVPRARTVRPSVTEVPLAGFLGIVPDQGPAVPRRRSTVITRPDDGPPPSLFLFSAWVSEQGPAIVRRQTGVRLVGDVLVLPAFAAAALGALVEDPGIARRRPPPVPPLARDPFPFAALAAAPALGAWFDDAGRVVLTRPGRRFAAQASDPILELIRPWLPDDVSARVARARRLIVPASEPPLGGIISSWFGGLDQAAALVLRRSLPRIVRDGGPPLLVAGSPWFEDQPPARLVARRLIVLPLADATPKALVVAPLLAWFEDTNARVLPRRRFALVVTPEGLVVVASVYTPAPDRQRAVLYGRANRGTLMPVRAMVGVLLRGGKRGVLK